MTSREVFTSTLMIHSTDKSLEYDLVEASREVEQYIDETFNVFNPKSEARLEKLNFKIGDYLCSCSNSALSCVDSLEKIVKDYSKRMKFGHYDMTCCLKGLLISLVFGKVFSRYKVERYFNSSCIVNFGGDMFGYNFSEPVSIEGCNLKFIPPERFGWACLTSGNFGRRGQHIYPTSGKIDKRSLTLAGSANFGDMAYLDALTTYLYSGGTEYKSFLDMIWVDSDGNPNLEVR